MSKYKIRIYQGASGFLAVSVLLFVLWLRDASTRAAAAPAPAPVAKTASARGVVTTRVAQASKPTRAGVASDRSKSVLLSPLPVHTPDESPAPIRTDSAQGEAPAEAESGDEETRQPYAAAASCKKIVPDNGALLMGGWPRPDGSHAFALVSPVSNPEAAPDGVQLDITCFSVPPEAMADEAWAGFTDTKTPGLFDKGAVLDQKQLAQFGERHQATFPNMLMAGLTTKHGEYASMTLGGPTDGFVFSVVSKRGGSPGETELAVSIAEYQGINGVHADSD